MSVRLHFDLSALIAARAVIGNDHYIYLQPVEKRFKITHLGDEDPHLHIGSEILQAEIPEWVDLKLVKNVTAFGNVFTAPRRIGEYRHKSASGVVSLHENAKYRHHITYKAKKLEDIKELHQMICQGIVWPTADHEAPMVPPPYRHLRQLIGEAWAIIRRDTTLRLRRT